MLIRKVSAAFPEREVDSSQIAEWCGSSSQFIEEKLGITSRRLLSPHENPYELALSAVKLLFQENSSPTPDQIKLCIFVGQSMSPKIPHISALLHRDLKLPATCACLDLDLACSGYIYALAVAQSMMQSYSIKDALIVTCDPYSPILNTEDRSTMPLFGDAATASWLSMTGPGLTVLDFLLGTDGSGADYLVYPSEKTDGKLYMDGKGILGKAFAHVPDAIKTCLARNNLNENDIELFIFHQANAYIVGKLRERLKIPEAKCPVFLEHTANTVSSSIPLFFTEKRPRLNKNKLYLLCAFGGGFSWGVALCKYTEDSDD